MRVAATLAIGAGALWGGLSGPAALGRSDAPATTQPAQAATVSLAQLPPEARQTHRLILAGGPFPYDKDGSVFGNRERLLPDRPRGHYREYTVRTPGARNRGARRFVCGGRPPTQPEACYYTDDHYASFRLVAQ
ncbi:ribonuclease [Piscinibacter sp. Jin2]|uniref:Ribonuclease n=1 Tax=Aquariibacter lacus TaxID=2801332 RepID=A0A9X0XD30_9BURK|nr:ribonuclease [Piscinibacter lacus]MBL0718721.1 ribonuclease [Piscinibacter lacus]